MKRRTVIVREVRGRWWLPEVGIFADSVDQVSAALENVYKATTSCILEVDWRVQTEWGRRQLAPGGGAKR